MPRKEFESFTRLDASDVNTFLMDQTVMSFAGTAARGSAIATPVEGMVTYLNDIDSLSVYNGTAFTTDRTIQVFPGTAARGSAIPSPVEGMYTHLEDTDALQFWNGSAWTSAARATGAGLVHIATQSVSGVTAINFNNVFSSAYTNYKVIVSGSASTRNELFARLRVGGVDASATDYVEAVIFRDVTNLTSRYNTAQTRASIGFAENVRSMNIFDVGGPFLTTKTSFGAIGASAQGAASAILWLAGNGHNLTLSYDGISILSANAFTGSVSIYGWKE
jgi:hypothetical protein